MVVFPNCWVSLCRRPAHRRRADDEPPFMLFVRRVNLRFGGKADMRPCLLLAQSGHPDALNQCLLLTQSGHSELSFAVAHKMPLWYSLIVQRLSTECRSKKLSSPGQQNRKY